MIQTKVVLPDDPGARFLLEMLQSEYVGLWGEADPNPDSVLDYAVAPQGGIILGSKGMQPVAIGGWTEIEPGVGCLHRMYVHYAHRRKGYSKLLLPAIENHARINNMHQMILDTTVNAVPALALYRGRGYVTIEPFGYWKDSTDSVFLGRDL